MAIKKLSLRRKADDDAQESGEEQAATPKKKLLLKKAVAPEVEEEEAEEAEEAPKKVLVKKRLGAGPTAKPEPVEEEEEEAEEEAPKKVLKKKAAPVEEEEETEEEEEEAPAPKKVLKKKAAPVEEEVEEEEETPAPKKKVLAKREEKAPVDAEDRAPVVYQAMHFGAIDGPIDAKDLMRPRIQMVQANSADLEEKGFSTGQIVLNGEILIWEKGFDALNMILMTGRKKFQQKLSDEEYKEGVIPLIFDSPEAVMEAGFTPEWDGDEPPTVDPVLFSLFLLEQPEYIDPDPVFNLEHGDRAFALAEMRFSGVNYRATSSGRWLISQSRSSLAPDSRHSMLAMTASREKQKKSGNIVTVASFKNLGKHKDPEFLEWVLSLG
jgi:chemotaxis protein histidine kinase CheA